MRLFQKSKFHPKISTVKTATDQWAPVFPSKFSLSVPTVLILVWVFSSPAMANPVNLTSLAGGPVGGSGFCFSTGGGKSGRLDPAENPPKRLSECELLAKDFGVTDQDVWGGLEPNSSNQNEIANPKAKDLQRSHRLGQSGTKGLSGASQEGQQSGYQATGERQAGKQVQHNQAQLSSQKFGQADQNQNVQDHAGQEQAGEEKLQGLRLKLELSQDPADQRKTQPKKQERKLSLQERKLVQVPDTSNSKELLAFGRKLEGFRSGSTAFSVARAGSLRALGKSLSQLDPVSEKEAHFFGRFLTLKYDNAEVGQQTIESAAKYIQEKGNVENADAKLCICLLMRSKDKNLRAFAAGRFAERLKKAPKAQYPKKVARLTRRLEGLVRFHRLVGNPMRLDGTDIDGQAFDLKELNGKVVLIHFWTLNCNACQKEISSLKHYQESLKNKGLRIVGVSADRNGTKVYQHLQKHSVTWTNLVSDGIRNPAIEYYGIVGAPTYVLVGRDGKVVATSNSLKKVEPILKGLFGIE